MGGRIYCLDASAWAASEDYATDVTRYELQKDVAIALLQSHAHLNESDPAAAIVVSQGKASRIPYLEAMSADVEKMRTAIDSFNPTGLPNSLSQTLKLAKMAARRLGQPSDIVLFIASPCTSTNAIDLTDSFTGGNFAEIHAKLHVIFVCPPSDIEAAVIKAFKSLGASITWLKRPLQEVERWQLRDLILEQLQESAEFPLVVEKQQSLPALLDSDNDDDDIVSSSFHRLYRSSNSSFSSTASESTIPVLKRGLAGVSKITRVSCRDNSLDRFLHLSSTGMLRRWLPTYSTVEQKWHKTHNAAGEVVDGSSNTAAAAAVPVILPTVGSSDCYIQVQPVPRYRTLLKVAAGRVALNENSSNGGESLISCVPEATKGCLRVLQDVKNPETMYVVWSATAGEKPRGNTTNDDDGSTTEALNIFALAPPSALGPSSSQPDQQQQRVSVPVVLNDVEYFESWGDRPPFHESYILRDAKGRGNLTLREEDDGSQLIILKPIKEGSGSFIDVVFSSIIQNNKSPRGLSSPSPQGEEEEVYGNTAMFWLQQRWSSSDCLAPPAAQAVSSLLEVEIKRAKQQQQQRCPNASGEDDDASETVTSVNRHIENNESIITNRPISIPLLRGFLPRSTGLLTIATVAAWPTGLPSQLPWAAGLAVGALGISALATACIPRRLVRHNARNHMLRNIKAALAAQKQQSLVVGVAGSAAVKPKPDDVVAHPLHEMEVSVQCLLSHPPQLDYAQMRRDVRNGLLHVAPIMLGPLPRELVASLAAKRAAIMQQNGVENFDTDNMDQSTFNCSSVAMNTTMNNTTTNSHENSTSRISKKVMRHHNTMATSKQSKQQQQSSSAMANDQQQTRMRSCLDDGNNNNNKSSGVHVATGVPLSNLLRLSRAAAAELSGLHGSTSTSMSRSQSCASLDEQPIADHHPGRGEEDDQRPALLAANHQSPDER